MLLLTQWQHEGILNVLLNYQSSLHYLSVLMVVGAAYLLINKDYTKLKVLLVVAIVFIIVGIICELIIYAMMVELLTKEVSKSGTWLLEGNMWDLNYLGTWYISSFSFSIIGLVFLILFAFLGRERS